MKLTMGSPKVLSPSRPLNGEDQKRCWMRKVSDSVVVHVVVVVVY